MTVPKRSWLKRLLRSRLESDEEKMRILESSDSDSELEIEVTSTSDELIAATSSLATAATHARAVSHPSPSLQLSRERTPPRVNGVSPYRSGPPQATSARSWAVAEPSEPIKRALSGRSPLSHLRDVLLRGHRPFRSSRKVRSPRGVFPAASLSNGPPPHSAIPEPAGQGDRELDRLLEEEWAAEGSVRGQRKLREELRRRLAEIAQREKTYVSELLCFDDATPLLAADEMERVLHTGTREERDRATSSGKAEFGRMRRTVKEEVLRRARALQSKRNSFSFYRRRGCTVQRPRDATQILSSWFELYRESDDPYPSCEEARELAGECGITVGQVWEWVNSQWQSSEARRLAEQTRS